MIYPELALQWFWLKWPCEQCKTTKSLEWTYEYGFLVDDTTFGSEYKLLRLIVTERHNHV